MNAEIDTCKEQLRQNVNLIVDQLESPPDVDEDGCLCEDAGLTWDADEEVWRDEDGDECDTREMSGMDFLQDALDIEYIVTSKCEYLGAVILVAYGGPSIRINTRRNRVEGAWWGDSFTADYTDNIGLDDACRELWECGA